MLISSLFMLILLSSNSILFEPFASEWTNPEATVVSEESIDLLQYGNPLISSYPDDLPHLACQAFFVEEINGAIWRINILYRDKLFVLQHNTESIEIFPGFSDCRYAIFSANGRYALVGAETGSDINPECTYSLIDVDKKTVIRFPITFDEALEPVFWIGTDGSVAMLAHGRRELRNSLQTIQQAAIPDTIFFYDSNLTLAGYHATQNGSPLAVRSADGSLMILKTGDTITCLDNSGNLLWERAISALSNHSTEQFYSLRLSADGSTFALSYSTGLFIFNAFSGHLLNTCSDFIFNTSLALSTTGNLWAGTYNTFADVPQESCMDIEYIVTGKRDNTGYTIVEGRAEGACSAIIPILFVSNEGEIIVCSRHQNSSVDRYFNLISRDGDLIWRSAPSPNSIGLTGNVSASWWENYEPFNCQTNDGHTYDIIYLSGTSLVIKSITLY